MICGNWGRTIADNSSPPRYESLEARVMARMQSLVFRGFIPQIHVYTGYTFQLEYTSTPWSSDERHSCDRK